MCCLGLLLLAIPTLLPGCSGNADRVPVVPVNGKVTFNGEVPVGAFIVFHPASGPAKEKNLLPSGKVAETGAFQLTTYDGQDGAPAGDYVVTIQWNKLVKKGSDVSAGPNVIPGPYSKPESSPWKATVAAPSTELSPYDIKQSGRETPGRLSASKEKGLQ